jgi:hypothetical protein
VIIPVPPFRSDHPELLRILPTHRPAIFDSHHISVSCSIILTQNDDPSLIWKRDRATECVGPAGAKLALSDSLDVLSDTEAGPTFILGTKWHVFRWVPRRIHPKSKQKVDLERQLRYKLRGNPLGLRWCFVQSGDV